MPVGSEFVAYQSTAMYKVRKDISISACTRVCTKACSAYNMLHNNYAEAYVEHTFVCVCVCVWKTIG